MHLALRRRRSAATAVAFLKAAADLPHPTFRFMSLLFWARTAPFFLPAPLRHSLCEPELSAQFSEELTFQRQSIRSAQNRARSLGEDSRDLQTLAQGPRVVRRSHGGKPMRDFLEAGDHAKVSPLSTGSLARYNLAHSEIAYHAIRTCRMGPILMPSSRRSCALTPWRIAGSRMPPSCHTSSAATPMQRADDRNESGKRAGE
jgi:hypothetical protein